MCDTMVALGRASIDGRVYFAKNSDRQPNEPHIMIQVPRKEFAHGSRVRCTYIEVEQSRETYAVILLKPSWIWGCEMGCNEFGLNIGNEAVFTREKYQPTGLTGMDMIRLALERCQTSQEALDLIIEMLQRYGQGGNCGFEKPFTYHNSFLITDPWEAWVLETAGEYWAAQKVEDIKSISNGLTIGAEFDRAHPDLIKHALEKGWCKSEQDFSFSRCYRDPLFTYFSGSGQRQSCSWSELFDHNEQVDAGTMVNILRSHHTAVEGSQFRRASLKSVCMHGGGPIGDHTTGSYAACLSAQESFYWVTGASTPCLAMFKPLWFMDNNPLLFNEGQEQEAIAYWQLRERLHRMTVGRQINNVNQYMERRDMLEKEWQDIAARLNAAGASDSEKLAFMIQAWQQEETLVKEYVGHYDANRIRPAGNPYYRNYWRRQTARLK